MERDSERVGGREEDRARKQEIASTCGGTRLKVSHKAKESAVSEREEDEETKRGQGLARYFDGAISRAAQKHLAVRAEAHAGHLVRLHMVSVVERGTTTTIGKAQ